MMPTPTDALFGFHVLAFCVGAVIMGHVCCDVVPWLRHRMR